ncbi:hypothetical protein U2A404210098 [Corynebacterium striatum]|nr:hypothetical protein U2A404210098 [Corynebacterium striatum]
MISLTKLVCAGERLAEYEETLVFGILTLCWAGRLPGVVSNSLGHYKKKRALSPVGSRAR